MLVTEVTSGTGGGIKGISGLAFLQLLGKASIKNLSSFYY